MKKDNKGFTLVELIVVITILAILAAIMVPACMSYIDKAREKEALLKARSVMTAAQAAYSEAYGYAKDLTNTGVQNDLKTAIIDLGEIGDDATHVYVGTVDSYADATGKKRQAYTINYVYYEGAKGIFEFDDVTGEWKALTATKTPTGKKGLLQVK